MADNPVIKALYSMIRVGSNKVLPYEKKLIQKVLNSNQISPDKYCKQFEEEFSKIHQVKHSAFVSSGTDALRIALLALKEQRGWKDGDVVLVPSITFVATVNVVLQAGLKPQLIDVGMYDYNMNPSKFARMEECSVTGKLDPAIRCVIVAHLFGQPADMDPILEYARKYKWAVVEDSCETMFVRYKGRAVGSFGDVSCFSTYACHLLSTGVGGFVCTQDEHLHSLIRSFANHGRDPAYIPGYSKPSKLEDFIDKHFKYDRIGYSSRGTELQAALGLGQLRVHKELLRKRQANANYLTNRLEKHWNHLSLPYPSFDREHAYMMYPIVIKDWSKVKKRDLMIYLGKNGIEARDMMPITNQPCYKGMFDSHSYSVADDINKNGFYIGCHPELTKKDLDKIVRIFDNYLK